ncbi:MAG: hypothetical protein ACLTDS_05565 [Bianqueaceae bacterium]
MHAGEATTAAASGHTEAISPPPPSKRSGRRIQKNMHAGGANNDIGQLRSQFSPPANDQAGGDK